MSAHTPGPWAPEFGESYTVRAPDGGNVAICTNLKGRHGMNGRRGGDEVADNARLIAAAPDLLDALVEISECPEIDALDMKRIADAAIAKAVQP